MENFYEVHKNHILQDNELSTMDLLEIYESCPQNKWITNHTNSARYPHKE